MQYIVAFLREKEELPESIARHGTRIVFFVHGDVSRISLLQMSASKCLCSNIKSWKCCFWHGVPHRLPVKLLM
ncbi:hypothetical protein VitviT2T_029477 [Vitis vinifera]|uniref:Uncharacterized protein n=1 Tax=Vitis vinifera TaxID=29760 RepID=A0ABY9DY55_VITVI|nr:hypothetical protein VitviT2T_029477 [Vitis vinifera]